MKVSFKLSDADRERYGGDEWVHFDTSKLADLGYDRLAELERDIKRYDSSSLTRILGWEWPRATMLGARGVVWLARQLGGFESPAWNDFKPNILGLTYEYDWAGDADPPTNGSSSEPPSETSKARAARSKKDSTS